MWGCDEEAPHLSDVYNLYTHTGQWRHRCQSRPRVHPAIQGDVTIWEIPRKLILYPIFPQNTFTHNLFFSSPIVLKFCTEHDSYTVVLCAKYQNDWATEIDAMDERDFARFEFKMSSVGKSCIATSPRWHYQPNTMCEDDLAKPGARASSALILDKHFNGIANMPHQYWGVYVLRPEQNGQHFTNYIYECIFRKEIFHIVI